MAKMNAPKIEVTNSYDMRVDKVVPTYLEVLISNKENIRKMNISDINKLDLCSHGIANMLLYSRDRFSDKSQPEYEYISQELISCCRFHLGIIIDDGNYNFGLSLLASALADIIRSYNINSTMPNKDINYIINSIFKIIDIFEFGKNK
jgi:hypothetical protein